MGIFKADNGEGGTVAADYTAPGMLSSLMSKLGNKDGLKRERARLALVFIGQPAVVSLVKALSDHRKDVRWEAAKALGDIADPAAAPAMVAALQDRVFDIRWLAAEGLIAMGREAIVPLVKALIENSNSVWLREGAHHILHDLAENDLDETVQPVLAALESFNPEVEVPIAAKIALDRLTG